MTNEEKKYEEALTRAAKKYQERIGTHNPQVEAWDFYNAFISGATWRDKQSTKEKQALIDKAYEWWENYFAPDGSIVPENVGLLRDFKKAMKGE